MSAAERRHMGRVAGLGCILCRELGLGETPAQVHHIGDTADRNGMLTIPLCQMHHTGPLGFHGLGERRFNAQYKTNELKLLAATLALLED